MTYSMHYVKKEYDALLYVKLKRNIWDSTKYLHNLYPLYLYLRAHIITNNFGHRVHASVLGPLNFVILPSFQSLYSTKTMELCTHWLWIGILHDHSFVAKKIVTCVRFLWSHLCHCLTDISLLYVHIAL